MNRFPNEKTTSMRHLQHPLAAALLLVAGSAGAQSMTLYGLIDTGVEYLNHVGPSGGSLTRMPTTTGGQLPSRWGVRGSEDLGNGMKAVFTLESGFAADSGSLLQSGRAFGRQAFVGLSGSWGTLTFGRHWTMSFFSTLDADVIGPAVFGMASFDNYLPNARTDNSISYRGTFSGLSLGATYSLGRDSLAPGNCGETNEGSGKACTAWSAMVKYDQPAWGVALAYDRLYGGPGAGAVLVMPTAPVVPGVTNLDFTSGDDRDSRLHVNGYWKWGEGAKLGVGWIAREASSAVSGDIKSNLYYVGATYPFTKAISLDGQVVAIRHDDRDADANLFILRGNYAFSKRTVAYVTAGYVDNKGTLSYSVSGSSIVPAAPRAGESQTGLMVGVRHSF